MPKTPCGCSMDGSTMTVFHNAVTVTSKLLVEKYAQKSSCHLQPTTQLFQSLTLNLHLVTTTNLSVWSLPRISSLHKMSSWWEKKASVRVPRARRSAHLPPGPRWLCQLGHMMSVAYGGSCPVSRWHRWGLLKRPHPNPPEGQEHLAPGGVPTHHGPSRALSCGYHTASVSWPSLSLLSQWKK